MSKLSSKLTEYNRESSRKIRIRNSRYVYDYCSTHPCVDCGENDPLVLEFDHVRGKKHRGISYMMGRNYSIAAFQLEIDKCEIRCANCHRRKTAIAGNYYACLTEKDEIKDINERS